MACAGTAIAYFDGADDNWLESDFARESTGAAFKTGELQVFRTGVQSPNYEAWKTANEGHSLRAMAALPLLDAGEVFAVLNVCCANDESFDNEEILLLSELAANIVLAIQALRAQRRTERANEALGHSAHGAINAISATIEKRDPYTAGHQARVADLSGAIATELGWSEFKIEGLRLGARIHDIGKIHVPAEILNRPGKLNEAEFAIIKSHPLVGYEILEQSEFPWPIRDMVLQHHERLDGSGYPHGLKGAQIIDEAKVIAVVDVVEAITAHRPYRPARGIDAALAEIESGKGSIYDAEIVDICVQLIQKQGFTWQD